MITSSRGLFITVEGVDGSGKSTHIPHIAEMLRRRGKRVVVTREPGGTPLAEKLRGLLLGDAMDPVTETLLMFAARREHVLDVIAPALAAGTWIVCDRFTDATFAYQGAGKGVPAELLERLAASVHPGLQPDRTLVFDCAYEVARARLQTAGRVLDRFELEQQEFFDRVRASYRDRAAREPARMVLIDGSRAIEEIKNELEKYIATL